MHCIRVISVVALLAMGSTNASASCGAAFCAVNSSWDVQGAWNEQGGRFDLRYENINLDRPATGSRRIPFGQIARHHDEQYTANRNWIAGVDYALNQDWSLSATVPVGDRRHTHVHNHGGGRIEEAWDFSAVGDARLLVRHRLATFEGSEPSLATLGVSAGLKLPTGRRDETNSAGTLAERPLQPGTGTTDALIGAHYASSYPVSGLSWFSQAMLQLPLNERDQFQPGRRLSVDAGLRYELTDELGVMVQLNALLRARDRGLQAEPPDTGGRALFLSPGASYAFTRELQGYAFLQLPVYQYVNGVQLVARRAAVLGLSARF